jgi:phage terminase large subunit-like protein
MARTTRRTTSSLPDDVATRYAVDVEAGTILAGPLVRAACKRHLADLKYGPVRGLFWDAESCARVVHFFTNVLRLPDGEHAGEAFMLQPWQAFVAGNIYGWRRGEGGPRRFRTAYVETGKGSGKSPLGGGLGLYMLTADGEHGAECYAAAVTRDQAKIPFRDAVRMVDASPALTRRLQKSGERDVFNLAYLETASFFRPVSSEGRGLDGKRVHFALIDEVHEHPTDVVIEKITAGVKGRRQPLIFEITNSGVDRSSICFQHHEYSERVVTGQIEDDEWFAYVCSLDESDDPFESEECWRKANPSLGITIQLEYLRKQVREAKGMPAKQSLVRRLNFCQWVDAANPAIDGEMWRACEAEFDENDLVLDGLECIGGMDLSGTVDLTALARVYEPDYDGVVHAVVEFWTPAATLIERANRDRVPYALWAKQGYIVPTPGRSVDYAFVAQRLSELQQECGLRRIAYDPYRIKYLEQDIDQIGLDVELVPHGQGYAKSPDSGLWMPHSVELLEEYIGKGLLRVKKNPALTFAAASAVHIADPKANRIYDKRRSTGRIDGIVALAMAMGAMLSEEQTFDVGLMIA